MASIDNLKRVVKRTKKQLKKQKLKLAYSKELPDKLKAKDEIERLKAKLSRLEITIEQQITMNNARKFSDVQRNKKAKGTERVQASDEVRPRRDSVGIGAPW